MRPHHELPAPTIDQRQELAPRRQVISVAGLVRMKLLANRDLDRVHLRDMIEVGLVGRNLLPDLSSELAGRLERLLAESGR